VRSINESYWNEILGRFNRLPVWLPGSTMHLGDVGIVEDGGWTKKSTLASVGIPFTKEPSGTPVNYDYCSGDGAEVRLKVSGAGGLLPGKLCLDVRFARAGACLLKAHDVVVTRVGDLEAVDQRIIESFKRKVWQRQWTVITEIAWGGPSATIISNSKTGTAMVDLGVQADLQGLPMGRLSVAPQLAWHSGLAASFLAKEPAALLWRGRQIVGRFRAARLRGDGLEVSDSSPAQEEGDDVYLDYLEDFS
jgi:hypothetical protein